MMIRRLLCKLRAVGLISGVCGLLFVLSTDARQLVSARLQVSSSKASVLAMYVS